MNAYTAVFLAAVPDGRVFGLDQQTLISAGIQLFNAALLAVALAYILYKPVRNFLNKRAERISGQMRRADDDMAKAAELKAQYEKKLAEIELERAEILESAHQLAAEKSRLLLAEAQKEAAASKERAGLDIIFEREQADEELRQQIIEIASLIAEKFLARAIDPAAHDRLIAETIAELEDTAWPS